MENINRQEFTGRWITTGDFANLLPINVFHRELKPAPEQKSPLANKHILFRKKFILEQPVLSGASAYIRISADDYYKLWINGNFVTQGPAPAYPFSYYYNTIDISKFLHSGENILAIHTLYQGLINRVWVSGDNRHGLILDLELDGKIIVQSDTSFRCHEHTGFIAMDKIGYATQFTEQYNSSSPEVGFEKRISSLLFSP
jgi:hypothetical protein